MSYTNPDDNDKLKHINRAADVLVFGLKRWHIWLLGVGFVAAFFIKTAVEERPPLRPVINAEPFVWSPGCKRKPEKGDISCDCWDPKYEIVDWKNRGLPTPGGRGKRYYHRVGNDAVSIAIFYPGGKSQYCKKYNVHRNFFSVKNSGFGVN